MKMPVRIFPSIWLPLIATLGMGTLAGISNARADAAVDALAALKEREQKVKALVEKVQPAVVCITTAKEGGTGSGVIINKAGLILTAAHVTQATGKELVIIFPDGKRVKGTALGANRGSDAGLAKIDDAGDYPFVEMGDSNDLALGDWCVALGHPGGFRLDRKPPVRIGRIWQRDAEGAIFSDNTLIGGDSGGPLFNLNGQVIAIHSSINAAAEHNRHIALDSFKGDWEDLMASKVWGDLRISGTDPNRPKLGLTFDREKQKGGALIAEIMPNTKASDAGIKAGDTITKFDGTEITNYWALMRELSDHKAGETIKLEAKRGDEVIPIELELLGRDGKAKPKVAEQPPEPKAEPKTAPKAEQKSARKDPAVPDTTRPRPYCGAELDGTKDTAELSGVSPDSPADKAGMKAGDVVTAVDGKPIKNALALSEKIRQHKPGDNISLTVKRGAEVLTLELTLAKK